MSSSRHKDEEYYKFWKLAKTLMKWEETSKRSGFATDMERRESWFKSCSIMQGEGLPDVFF